MPLTPIAPSDITGLVLAGGQGTRMGGADKGLQPFGGVPLAEHALRRLQAQVGGVMVSANRNLPAYQALGVPVLPDSQEGFAGPLAGLLAGLAHCPTPWLLAVPCDAPLFPDDLALRLACAATEAGALIALAAAPDAEAGGALRPQPVFCLVHTTLHGSLARYLAEGGRKAGAWAAQHQRALAPFDRPGDPPLAFANANTLAELQQLEPAAGQAR